LNKTPIKFNQLLKTCDEYDQHLRSCLAKKQYPKPHPLSAKFSSMPKNVKQRVIDSERLQVSIRKLKQEGDRALRAPPGESTNRKKSGGKTSVAEKVRYFESSGTKVREVVPIVAVARRAGFMQAALAPVAIAQQKLYNKGAFTNINGQPFSDFYLATAYCILFFLDAVNGRLPELQKCSKYLSAIFYALQPKKSDGFAYEWSAPETLFGINGWFPIGSFSLNQFGVNLNAVDYAAPLNPDGSHVLYGAPAALTDVQVREYGKASLQKMLSWNSSKDRPLVDVTLYEETYLMDPSAFAAYRPVKGYNSPGNLDYPGETFAMYNRALLEVETPENSKWLQQCGFADDSDGRDGYSFNYFGNGLSSVMHVALMGYGAKDRKEDYFKIKNFDLYEGFRSYLVQMLGADFYRNEGNLAGPNYTLAADSPLRRISLVEMWNTYVLSIIHKMNWGAVASNCATDPGYVTVAAGTVTLLSPDKWNMLMPANISENFRSLYPVPRGKTMTYVVPIMRAIPISLAVLETAASDAMSTILGEPVGNVVGFELTAWGIISYAELVAPSKSLMTTGLCELAFSRMKMVSQSLSRNCVFESFSGEQNYVDNTLVHYTDHLRVRNFSGIYLGTTNVEFIDINDMGWDMSHQLPALLLTDDQTDPFAFTIKSLLSFYDERFALMMSAFQVVEYNTVLARRVMDYFHPTNTATLSENSADNYEAICQHLGGGLFRYTISDVGKVLSKAGPLLKKFWERGKRHVGEFVKGAIEDAVTEGGKWLEENEKNNSAKDEKVKDSEKEIKLLKEAGVSEDDRELFKKWLELKKPQIETSSGMFRPDDDLSAKTSS
jgi:hypothetical protein